MEQKSPDMMWNNLLQGLSSHLRQELTKVPEGNNGPKKCNNMVSSHKVRNR